MGHWRSWLAVAVVALGLTTACTDDADRPSADTAPTPSPSPASTPPSPSVDSIGPAPPLDGTAGGGGKRLAEASLSWATYAGPAQAIATWVLPRTPGSLGPDALVTIGTADGWRASGTAPVVDSAALTSDGRVAWWSGPRRLRLLDRTGHVTVVDGDLDPAAAPRRATLVGSSWSILGVETDLWWLAPGTRTAHPVPSSEHIGTRFAAVRDDTGRLWVQGWDRHTRLWLAWTDDGGATWTERSMARRGYPGGIAVGRDGQVAAFGWISPHSHGVVSRSIISRDHGRTWQPFARGSGPAWVSHEGTPGGPGSVTTLPDGSLYVVETRSSGVGGRLWRATGDWTDLHPVEVPGGLSWVQSNGDLVWGGHGDRDLLLSSDGGATWHSVSPR